MSRTGSVSASFAINYRRCILVTPCHGVATLRRTTHGGFFFVCLVGKGHRALEELKKRTMLCASMSKTSVLQRRDQSGAIPGDGGGRIGLLVKP